MTAPGVTVPRTRVAVAAAILVIAGSVSAAAGHSQRTRTARSYSSLNDIPPTLGERLPCRGGADIAFYGDGILAECTLSRRHAIQGKTFAAGTVLRFDVDGRRIAPAP